MRPANEVKVFGLGVGEIVIILFIALIFIGPKKLPELARGLGKGMREFQNAAKGLQDHIRNPVDEVKDQIENSSAWPKDTGAPKDSKESLASKENESKGSDPKENVSTAESSTPAEDQEKSKSSTKSS